MRGSSVVGCSIHDSDNRFLTVHGTDYLVVRDNVGYRCAGHGFFLEDGTEVYNVLDRNLAVLATAAKRLPKQILDFDQNEGGRLLVGQQPQQFYRQRRGRVRLITASVTRPRPAPHAASTLRVRQPDGTRQSVDIRTLPFVRFDGNEAHSSHGLYGVKPGRRGQARRPGRAPPVRGPRPQNLGRALRLPPAGAVPAWSRNLSIDRASYGVYHPELRPPRLPRRDDRPH